jgi:hypothetical protein
VAPHAWSPPNFPHSDKEAKERYAATVGHAVVDPLLSEVRAEAFGRSHFGDIASYQILPAFGHGSIAQILHIQFERYIRILFIEVQLRSSHIDF